MHTLVYTGTHGRSGQITAVVASPRTKILACPNNFHQRKRPRFVKAWNAKRFQTLSWQAVTKRSTLRNRWLQERSLRQKRNSPGFLRVEKWAGGACTAALGWKTKSLPGNFSCGWSRVLKWCNHESWLWNLPIDFGFRWRIPSGLWYRFEVVTELSCHLTMLRDALNTYTFLHICDNLNHGERWPTSVLDHRCCTCIVRFRIFIEKILGSSRTTQHTVLTSNQIVFVGAAATRTLTHRLAYRQWNANVHSAVPRGTSYRFDAVRQTKWFALDWGSFICYLQPSKWNLAADAIIQSMTCPRVTERASPPPPRKLAGPRWPHSSWEH